MAGSPAHGFRVGVAADFLLTGTVGFMGKPSIAVFSVSAGTGHVRAAEAIVAAAEKHFPGVTVIHTDLMTLVPPLFKTLYADSYFPLVEHHPALWGYLYEKSDKRRLDSATDRLRIAIERLHAPKLKQLLLNLNPDAVVCTHFLPAELFARWRRRRLYKRPVWVVVTDFDVHMLWVSRHVTGYCVANEEVACRLQDRGVDPDSIQVTGIPIMPAFAKKPNRADCAREFGIDPAKLTLLLMSGGAGVESIRRIAGRILEIKGDFQLIALAGKNQRLLADLQRIARNHSGRMVTMGFTRNIERVMAAADLAITKSGGLTTSECMAMGLPMLVMSPIPGQEERNADFVLEHGAGLKAYDEAGMEYRIAALFADPSRIATMSLNAQRIGKPDAGKHVIECVLGSISSSILSAHRDPPFKIRSPR